MLLLLFSGTTGGTVNYSLTCDAGAYVLSGQAATLTRGYSLACDAGAYTLTGQDATLIYGHQLALDAGAYSLSGQDAILTRGYQLACDAGAYVLSGQDATLTYSPGGAPVNYTLSCDAGAYVLTGQDADLVYTSRATGGGVPKWNPYRPQGETEEQKRIRREAQGIIAKAKVKGADIPALFEQAKQVSGLIKADIDRLEKQAAEYQELLTKRRTQARIEAFAMAQNDALAQKQLQQALVEIQIQAELMAQQAEELDIVFIAVMLAAL